MVWLKRLLWLLVAVIIVGLILGFIYRDPLERLYRVNTLFDEDRIVSNFSNMRAMFLSDDIARSGPVFEFEEAPRPLPKGFESRDGSQDVAEFLQRTKTTSLLVIRDGKVEFEDYYLGTKPEDLRISWSVAKSFMSALLGIAISEGAIKDINDPVITYVPSLKGSAYESVTLRDVAMMSSGVKFNEDYFDYNSDINQMGRELALGGSLDNFTAALKERVAPAGENWRYVSIDTHVLGMAVRNATSQRIADYMAEKIWSRIGAEADAYFVTDGDGNAFVLGGLNISTRDYARFGRLMLNDGMWNGEQIIPKDWVRVSTSNVAPPTTSGGRSFGNYYGFQWWQPPETEDVFYGVGVYGQFLYIDRKTNVIIVKTSADRNFRDNDDQSQYDSLAFFATIAGQ